MKTLLKSKYLPLLFLGLGAVGFFLRKGLYASALDGKNLLLRGQPLEIVLWLAAAVALAVALLSAKQAAPVFPGSRILRSAGSVVAAIGIGLTVLLGKPAGTLGIVWMVLGVLSFASLDVAAKQQWDGKQPFFLLHAIVCVFFAVHMVSCYQGWSSNPQIQDYVFTLLASVGLMLFAYQKAACAVSCGSQKLLRFFGLVTVFTCCTALSGTEYPLLYLAGMLWTLSNSIGE